MVVRHAFPLYTPLLQKNFTRLLKSSSSRDAAADQIWALRRVYAYTILVGTIPRVVSLTLSFATVLSQTLFSEDYIEAIGPKSVFLPSNPLLGSLPAKSFAEGLLPVLQYEEAIGGLTTLVWALLTTSQSWKGDRVRYWTIILLGIPFLTFLTGPIGCAVILVWIRDETVFSCSSESKGEARRLTMR